MNESLSGTSVILYVLDNCVNCEEVKNYLNELEISFGTRKMNTARALTELRLNNVFVMIAPVLRNGSQFMTISDLYSADGRLNRKQILEFLLSA